MQGKCGVVDHVSKKFIKKSLCHDITYIRSNIETIASTLHYSIGIVLSCIHKCFEQNMDCCLYLVCHLYHFCGKGGVYVQ